MGIGRRNFLKLTSIALTGIAVDPLRAVVTNNNAYVNKKLGILFYKPNDWGFVNIKDFGEIKDKQILGNGWNNDKDKVWEDLGDPICIATKYWEDLPQYKGVFSPTITLNITHKSELEGFYFKDFKTLMAMSQSGVSQLLKGFKVIKKYVPYKVSNCNFYEYDAEYLFEHVELKKPLKVDLKVIKAEHNDFYYDFNCHQSKEANQIAHNEFKSFKNSIKLI